MRRQNMPQPQMQMQRNMNYQQYDQNQQYEYDDEEDQHGMDEYGEYDQDEEGQYVFENEEEYLQYQQMREQQLAQQGIHLIEYDPNFEPTEEEILAYAEFLGMNLEEDQEFFYLAREGLVAPLPEGWCYAQVDGEEAMLFYCRETQELYEENPNDEYFRNKFEDEKRLKEIKKQRENPPAAASKKRSKLQNLIDQYSNTNEEESNKSKQESKQNMKSQEATNVNISNIEPTGINSNKNSTIGIKNEQTSLSHIAGQQTSKNLSSKQNSVQETNISNAKTIKNKLNPLEPLNEKFSKEITDSKQTSNIGFGKKESEYEFDEDEHAFLQSDEEDEDKKSRQSSNLPNKNKGSILDTKSQNSRPPSASNKNKESRAASTVSAQSQTKVSGKEKDSSSKETSSKDTKKKVDELEEVDLEDIQKQEISKNLQPLKLNPLDKKPSALQPLEKKSSKDLPSQTKESGSKKNTLKDIPSILEASDNKIVESDQKLDGQGFTLGTKQSAQKKNSESKQDDLSQPSKSKESKSDAQNEKARLSQEIDSQIKEDFDKNFASSGQKYISVESQKKTDNSKSNDYNLTKEFEDAENQTYTYSKEESISQDQISDQKKSNQEFSPYVQQQQSVSPSIPKLQEQFNKKLIKIEEHLSDNESESSPAKQQNKRNYNVETQEVQQIEQQQEQNEEQEEDDETVEMDIQSLEIEDQINIQAYIEEKEEQLNRKLAFFEKDIRQNQVLYNQKIQGDIFSNYDSVGHAKKRREYLQEQEKTRIRQHALKEISQQEDVEIKRIQSNLDEAVNIFKQEENFVNEQKVGEFTAFLKDKFFKKLEQHEKIIKNLKGIISKNDIIHSQQRKLLQEKFNTKYQTALFQQSSAKYQSDLIQLEKDFEIQQQNAVADFEIEFERTKQLEQDEIQKQKINQTVKMLDLKEIYIKRYYLEKSERESDMTKQLENMYKVEKDNLDKVFLEKYQQELNQIIYKKQKINESELEFINQMNEQKLADFAKLTMKESDHKIKLLEIEHSRRLKQLEDQLREQKGLKNNYKYIEERQHQTNSDIKLQIVEINNLIYLKKQQFEILKQENKKLSKDQQDLHFNQNIVSNEANLEVFLRQQLENRINSINHLKERQKQKDQDIKLIKQQKQQLQTPQQNNLQGIEITDISHVLLNYPHTSEKLYQNKKRSKLWTECIKQENSVIDQQKQKLKFQKIYLKTVYLDIQKEKEKQKEEIEKIKKQNDINEQEKQYLIQNIQPKSKNLVQQFNEDVKLVRRNEELMRKRDEQLLSVEKQFNKTMNLGLDEDNLIEAYIKLKKLTGQPLKELKLVPNNEIDIKTKVNHYQDLSSYLDVTGDDQANENQGNPEMYQKFEFGDTEVNKEPHQLRQIYQGLQTPFIKGVMQQRQDQNQYNVERIDNLLKNAKYSQQIMSAKFNGFLQRREYAKVTENVARIKSEVSQHQQWFKDVKQYINQTLYDRTNARSQLNTII